MKSVLIGEVRTAEQALNGLVAAGQPPCAILTTDIRQVQQVSGMGASYYCDLESLGQSHDIPTKVVSSDLRLLADELRALSPDYLWIMGWPYIVREPILSLAPCIGMHPTPLPERRGGAPMNWTILDGETSSAVTLFRLRAGIDDGEILLQRRFEVDDDDYVGDVAERIYRITEELVEAAAVSLVTGSEKWHVQNHSRATYTRRRKPADGCIVWSDSIRRIRNLVRATSHPFPGAFSKMNEDVVRIWRAESPMGYRAPLKVEPGTILEVRDDGALIATSDNALLITEAQLDGGAPLSGSDLASAFSQHAGARFS